MRKAMTSALLGLCSLPTLAGMCETTWNGDKIANALAGHSLSQTIPLKRDQEMIPITYGQLKVFYDAKQAISRRAGLTPSFIICSDTGPNAFAMPTPTGDVIGVTVGMIRMANGDPDMAAMVVGHEVAHHVRHHVSEGQANDALLGLLGTFAGIALEYGIQKRTGGTVIGVGMDIGRIGATLTARKFGRDQEREADDLGLNYLVELGYDPAGAVRLARKFQQAGMSGGGYFFDSHPGWDEREGRLRTAIDASPKARELIAQYSETPRTQKGFGGEAHALAALNPDAELSEAQRAFQEGMRLWRSNRPASAYKHLKVAAEAGYATAQLTLSAMYDKADGVEGNPAEAFAWAKKAADQGEVGGEFAVANMYRYGRGVAADPHQAFAYGTKAAAHGTPLTQCFLGQLYASGTGTEKAPERAFEIFKSGAKSGDPMCLTALANAYADGTGVSADQNEALRLLRQAEDKRYAPAVTTLGMWQFRGEHGIKKDTAAAVETFRKAADLGDGMAYFMLGVAYENGIGAPVDKERALNAYKMAYIKRVPDARKSLERLSRAQTVSASPTSNAVAAAELCESVAAVADNPAKNIRLTYFGFIDVERALAPCTKANLEAPSDKKIQAQLARILMQLDRFKEGVELAKSAQSEQPAAKSLLAFAYRHGIEVERDTTKAQTLLEDCAVAGDGDCMTDLSGWIATGAQPKSSGQNPLHLLQRAADLGNLDALNELAMANFEGKLGLPKNEAEGIRLLRKAADSDYPVSLFLTGASIARQNKRLTPDAQQYLTRATAALERYAAMGSARARFYLGLIYNFGMGTPKDPAKALALWTAAAKQHMSSAALSAGVLLLEGKGVPKDSQAGRRLIEQAAEEGNTGAKKKLAELSN